MDKILRIHMSAKDAPQVTVETLGKYAGLGGRAMTSGVISSEVKPDCDPLGEGNKIVIAPGLLSGTAAATSGRLSIGCKSPLTGTIKESNSGGQAALTLARLGYAAIIIEGISSGSDLYRIVVTKDKVVVEDANEFKELTNYQLIDKVRNVYGKKVACISIGPAGERGLKASTIACTDPEMLPTRHAARGGVGAVLGSKGIKLIVLDGEGTSIRKPKYPYFFKKANKQFVEGLRRHPVTGYNLPKYGTNLLTNIVNEAGAYPTRNFQSGRFAGAEKICGEALAKLEESRGAKVTKGCHTGCVIQCSGNFNDKDGNFVTKQPEYETVWAHGGNCMIDDLDIIAKLDFMDDTLGLDTIEMGTAIGIAMEAGKLAFGDGEGALKLLDEVANDTPFGRILGNGAAATAEALGVTRVPVVKRQAMSAYDPRGMFGMGVTYATSTMGADHTAGSTYPSNLLMIGGFVDPLDTDDQIELSRLMQMASAAIDASGFCLMIAYAILDQTETYQAMIDLINSGCGMSNSSTEFLEIGKTILKEEKAFNDAAGFTRDDDRLPEFFYKEPLEPHGRVFEVSDLDLDQVHNW